MKSVLFGLIMIWLSVSTVFAGSYTFTNFNYPGAVNTRPYGINNSGKVVGIYDTGTYDHGFIYSGGTYSTIDYPGATETKLYAISNNSQILGRAMSEQGVVWDYYFVRSSPGVFYNVYPPSNGAPNGINNNGQLVGSYMDATGRWHAYVGDSSDTIDYPGASGTSGSGINDSGVIAGAYGIRIPIDNNSWTYKEYGFTYDGSNFTSIEYPGTITTDAVGVNNKGIVVGNIYEATTVHAYVYSEGSFSILDYPGAKYTWANGINDNGEVVGGGRAPTLSAFMAF